MYSKLVYFAVCIVAISRTNSQKLFPVHSNNPMNYVNSFVEKLTSDGLEEDPAFLEKLSDRDELIGILRNLSIHESFPINISQCTISYVRFWKDLLTGKKYALKMLDAWGKLESGIELGNIQWMGRYHECLNAHAENFSGQYFYLMYGLSSSSLPVGLGQASAAIGACFPSPCSASQVQQIVSPLFKLIKQSVTVYSPVQPTKYTSVDVVALLITCILGFLVIVATVYDFYLTKKEVSSAEYRPLDSYPEISQQQKTSLFSDLILSFSFIKNTKAVFNTTQKEGNINVLHGLRFFSMTWVILGHAFIFGANYIDNGLDAARVFISDGTFQAVGNATFSVDSFFFLSGLLAAYLGLKEMKKRSGKINVPLMFAYRYLRLTPAYAFCILISASLYSKFGDGPYWPKTAESFQKPCQSYWWTNLLYINNMYPASLGDECFAWGWYLANDMQFFLLLPLFLILLHKRPWIGALVLNIGVICSMIATGVISSHYKQQPMALGIGLAFHAADAGNLGSMPEYSNTTNVTTTTMQPNVTTTMQPNVTTTPGLPPGPSESDIFWSDIYAKPWCRMGAYFVGILAGLIMYKSNTRVRMNEMLAILGWGVASATALALVYGLHGSIKDGEYLSISLAAFYNAVSRPLWTFCLLWLVMACAGGYGGAINTFLSWKALIPLSRLTYCAYLVHPLVIFWVYGIMETKLHFSLPIIAVIYAGIVPISYSIAFVVSILIEMPMLGITKSLFGKMAEVKREPLPVVSEPNESGKHHGNVN